MRCLMSAGSFESETQSRIPNLLPRCFHLASCTVAHVGPSTRGRLQVAFLSDRNALDGATTTTATSTTTKLSIFVGGQDFISFHFQEVQNGTLVGPKLSFMKIKPTKSFRLARARKYYFFTPSPWREGEQRKEFHHPFFNPSQSAVPLAEMFMSVWLSFCVCCGIVKLFLVKYASQLEKIMLLKGNFPIWPFP